MKKVLFTAMLLVVASFSYAQKKNVKQAKSIATSVNPDFKEAQKLINEALANPETKEDPETWDVAALVQKRMTEKQMEKAYLRKPYDTVQVYNSTLNMFKYYLKCDELAQIPNAKGKIKNKYRKNNATNMKVERPNLINGGIHYFNNNDNKKAIEFFGMYVDVAAHEMLEKDNLLETDTVIPQIAYYAALAAAKDENNDAILKYAPYAKNDPEVGKYAMEFEAIALKATNQTDKWIAVLKEGLTLYPDHAFFFGHLIDYYTNNNKFDDAMEFADGMIAKDPENPFFLYVKAFLFHNTKEYDKATEFYQKTIAVDPSYAEAYSNLGLIYCLKAQDFAEDTTTDINDPKYVEAQKQIKSFYQEAKPYYEKARELKPEQQDLWMQGLYRVYYNLNMGKEFEEIESLMQ